MIIHYCDIIPNNMSKQEGKRTAKIIFGEILVSVFAEDSGKILTTHDLEELARSFSIRPINIAEIIKREFAGAIKYDRGLYTLSEDWGVSGLLDAVNDQRRRVSIPPFEIPRPNLKERQGS